MPPSTIHPVSCTYRSQSVRRVPKPHTPTPSGFRGAWRSSGSGRSLSGWRGSDGGYRRCVIFARMIRYTDAHGYAKTPSARRG